MLTQTDIERERYESRRKAQMDHNSFMNAARREGQAIGQEIGVIHLCEQMLHRPESPEQQLLALSLENLKRLAEDLKKQVLNQR